MTVCNAEGVKFFLPYLFQGMLGLDVLPEYRGHGLGRELVYQYLRRESENCRKEVFLTCLQAKVKMYKKFGFVDRGIANSTWGGEEWHEMSYTLG